jgi:NDP-sugar pyrophosphorylase family protein
MQAVILAAGTGTRLRPLTLERPKPLVLVAGRPILEYIIDALPKEVDEIILVVGYKREMIMQHFGTAYKGRTIKYVHQWMPAGTAHGLSMAEPFLRDDRFIFMFADDIHGKGAFEEALQYPLAILAARHEDPSRFGVIELNADGTLASIVEKPEVPPTNLISTGAMVLDKRIFNYKAPMHVSGEYYLTDPLSAFAKDYPIQVIEQKLWIPIGYPEDIAIAEEILMKL